VKIAVFRKIPAGLTLIRAAALAHEPFQIKEKMKEKDYKLNHNLANNPRAEGLQKRAAFITMRFSVFN